MVELGEQLPGMMYRQGGMSPWDHSWPRQQAAGPVRIQQRHNQKGHHHVAHFDLEWTLPPPKVRHSKYPIAVIY